MLHRVTRLVCAGVVFCSGGIYAGQVQAQQLDLQQKFVLCALGCDVKSKECLTRESADYCSVFYTACVTSCTIAL